MDYPKSKFSFFTGYLTRYAAWYLAVCTIKQPEMKKAPNYVTLFFKGNNKIKHDINVECIKHGRYSSHQMMLEYEELLRDIVRGDISPEVELEIKNIFNKFERKI